MVGIVVIEDRQGELFQIVLTLRTRSSFPHPSQGRQHQADNHDDEKDHYPKVDPLAHLDRLSFLPLVHNCTTNDRCQHVRICDVVAL